MTRPDHDVHVETERMLAEVGIVVTDEGRARPRGRYLTTNPPPLARYRLAEPRRTSAVGFTRR